MALHTIDMNTPGLDTSLAFRDSRMPGSLVVGTLRTAELADVERVVRFTDAGASTFTIPADATVNFPIGTILTVARDGTGSVTIAAAAGVTINKGAGLPFTIGSQFSLVNARKTAANTWFLFGALA